MIGIRADANRIIASGHVMRCITVAKQVCALGGEVTFFMADEESEKLFNDFSKDIPEAKAVVLGSNWQDMEGELPRLKKEILARSIDFLLVDSYKVTIRYFDELSKVCRTAYMDDLGKEAYPVNILINYSGFYEMLGYDRLYEGVCGFGGEKTRLLTGLLYAPLREQFSEPENSGKSGYEVSDKVRKSTLEKQGHFDILLAAGGADMYGMLLGVLKELESCGLISPVCSDDSPDKPGDVDKAASYSVTVHTVAGSLVSNIEEIRSFASSHEHVYVHERVTNMAELMSCCDFAVSAAGTMLTECAAKKLPVIFYQVADNQKLNAEFWQKSGGMLFAGDVTERGASSRQVLGTICRMVRDICEDPCRIDSMSRALEGLTDGRGAQRIAKELLRDSLMS